MSIQTDHLHHIPPAPLGMQGEYQAPRPQDLGVMATKCPCSMDSACKQDCCVDALRGHKEHAVVRVKDRNSTDCVTSYGSMDGLDGGCMMVSPVDPKRGEDSEPLLNSERSLVRLSYSSR